MDELPGATLHEFRKLAAPRHRDVRAENVDLTRLGAALAVAYERDLRDFASLLLLGKDRHPLPVPLKTYDESISVLRKSLDAARLGGAEKMDGLRRLDRFARAVEERSKPQAVFGDAQLSLFDEDQI